MVNKNGVRETLMESKSKKELVEEREGGTENSAMQTLIGSGGQVKAALLMEIEMIEGANVVSLAYSVGPNEDNNTIHVLHESVEQVSKLEALKKASKNEFPSKKGSTLKRIQRQNTDGLVQEQKQTEKKRRLEEMEVDGKGTQKKTRGKDAAEGMEVVPITESAGMHGQSRLANEGDSLVLLGVKEFLGSLWASRAPKTRSP